MTVKDLTGKAVASIAWHAIREHQDDLTVGDTQSLDRVVETQGIRDMAIVEPESTRVYL